MATGESRATGAATAVPGGSLTPIGQAGDDRAPGRDEAVIEVEPHNCFACGSLNDHGLHLDLHVARDRCWTELTLADQFQGWDRIAHGGIVATILDEVMAWSLASTDNWGVTARIAVTFRKPVPIGSRIRAEGWIEDNRRRLIQTAARIVDPADDTLLATAEATYVAAGPERKRELQARYRFRIAPAATAGADRSSPAGADEPAGQA